MKQNYLESLENATKSNTNNIKEKTSKQVKMSK
jgi:hypothetical protein